MYDELVKALRECGGDGRCWKCPYSTHTYPECENKLHTDAADAIEKLMAEVDHKDKVIHDLLNTLLQKEETIKAISTDLQNRIEHQNATIDSLYKTIEKLTEQKENGNE